MNLEDGLKDVFYTQDSSAASSDARIPLLTSTGDTKGSDTMANIASVLDAKFTVLNDNDTDLNNLTDSGRYLLNAVTCVNAYTSNTIRGTLEVINTSTGITQRITEGYPSAAVYVRGQWNGNWTAWSRVDNFGCNDLGSLASALGGISPSLALGQVVASGVLDNTNYPTSYGTVIVFNAFYKVEVCVNWDGGSMWIRTILSDGTVNNWYSLAYSS